MIVNPGDRYNDLVVIGLSKKKSGVAMKHYYCQCCNCGNLTIVAHSNLRGGHTKTCGRCKYVGGNNRHFDGTSCMKVRIYRIYVGIKDRCRDDHEKSCNYSDRGISVCDRWLESFDNFFNDMGHPPSDKHSIDRIDPNGIYEPLNCRWATQTEQMQNTSSAKGYHWKPKKQKWKAKIKAHGRDKHLGYFDTEVEARATYLEAKKVYHQSDKRPEVVRRLHECWSRFLTA